jgi:5-formyltetrahydrofolate cyclo-ligase
VTANDLSAAKAELRNAALERRQALSPEIHADAKRVLAVRGLPIPVTPESVLAGYWPIRSELDPLPLMQYLVGAFGARLALPVIVARDAPLLFREWSPEDELVAGAMGILEPTPGAPELLPDILLVPLAAFDRAGHRIGYGAGHYDRTFARLRAIKPFVAIGVAFDTQEIAAVPAGPHDVALDYVLTETRTIDFRSI